MKTLFHFRRVANSGRNICGIKTCDGCRKSNFWLFALFLIGQQVYPAMSIAQAVAVPAADSFSGKPRVVIISDMGNEPDDQMSFVRLLVYSNELDLEALIAGTSTWQKTKTHPETMHQLISAYGQVRGNLMKHAAGWP